MKKGFTLVELMVVVAIIGTLFTTIGCATQWDVRQKVLDIASFQFNCDRPYLTAKLIGTHLYEVEGCRQKAIYRGEIGCYNKLTIGRCQIHQVNPNQE